MQGKPTRTLGDDAGGSKNMSRLNVFLCLILMVSAFSMITSQEKTRALHIALENTAVQNQRMDEEIKRLESQQASLAQATRIESVARQQLGMQRPVQSQLIYMTPSSLTPSSSP